MKISFQVAVWLFWVIAIVSAQDPGRLRRFEQGETASGTGRTSTGAESLSGTGTQTESSTFTDSLLEELVFRPVVYGLMAGGEYAQELSGHRRPGDPMFPLLRLDLGGHYISSDLHAFGYGLEAGQGLLAAEFRHTYYRDRLFDETLHQFQMHFLYRMAAHRRTQVDVAMGAMTLHGEDTQTAFSVGLPMRYWPSKFLGIEVRPLWAFFPGGTLMDVDAGLLLRFEHSSLRVGYRWVERGEENLSGPRIGLSFRF